MRAKDAIGRYGEELAARHLVDSGLVILDRNWRCADGELDIVACDGEVLVFCEVKTRSSSGFGDPSEAVGAQKASRLRRLALRWLAQQQEFGNRSFWPQLRFDVISVLCERQSAPKVNHVRAAFS